MSKEEVLIPQNLASIDHRIKRQANRRRITPRGEFLNSPRGDFLNSPRNTRPRPLPRIVSKSEDYSTETQKETRQAKQQIISPRIESKLAEQDKTIKDLELELKSVKKHYDNRLNQIENRFTNLEGRLYELNYPNDPNYDNERPLY